MIDAPHQDGQHGVGRMENLLLLTNDRHLLQLALMGRGRHDDEYGWSAQFSTVRPADPPTATSPPKDTGTR